MAGRGSPPWRAALWRLRLALRHRTSWVPVAPLAAVMVLALVVGAARLAFTGTVRFDPDTSAAVAGAATASTAAAWSRRAAGAAGPAEAVAPGPPEPRRPSAVRSGRPAGAVLVIAGFGSTCCHSANALRAAEPHMLVRQFSYLGLNAAGQPIPYGLAGNLSIQVIGDRLATQVEALYRQAGQPVDIVAESEGTLGLYAMLARHPHVPLGSVVLLSPIIEPGQFGQAGGTVPGAALTTLNNLIGGMSPYGRSGAQALIDSVSEVGASYFAQVSHDQRPALAGGRAARRRGHAARLPLAGERDLHRRAARRPARR